MSKTINNPNKLALRLIVFIIMLMPLLGFYPAYNIGFPETFTAPVELLVKGEAKTAVIKRCYSRDVARGTQKAQSFRKKQYRQIYAPIAETAMGESAKGGFILNNWRSTNVSKTNCESTIGREVPVRIHPTDSSKSHIATLVHLWYPLVQILLALAWIVLAKRNRVIGGIILGFNFIVIPALLYLEYISLW